MTYKWTELAATEQPRGPLADFSLNVMERFIAADLGLNGDDSVDEGRSNYDEQWWLALVTVARANGEISSLKISDLVTKAAEYRPEPLSDSLVIPGEYGPTFRSSTDLDVITIYARRDYLNAANASNGEESLGISSIMVSVPLESGTLNPSAVPFLPPDLDVQITPQTVVTAVIDHGIAIAHDLFRRENAAGDLVLSRVDFFLDMDGVPDPDALVKSTVGRVWTRAEIEVVLKDNFYNGLLDEAAAYRELGLINRQTRSLNTCAHRVSHGTHVTGLASGYPAADDTGAERRIIAVQLPTRLVANTLGFGLEQALEQALLFIAGQMAHYKIGNAVYDPPLVMNFSFGNFMGPHDGTGEVERVIDTVLTNMAATSNRPRLLLLPSGNGNLSRCHAVINLTNAAPAEDLDWVLQPADRSASILSVWLPLMTPVPDGTVTLEITVPGFDIPHTLTAGMTPSYTLLTDTDPQGNDLIIGIVVYLPPRAPTFRGLYMVLVAPTDHPMNVRPVAPSGNWTLRIVKAAGVDELALKIWVQRDETLPGFPEFGRQSYLSDTLYQRFDRPGGTVIVEDPVSHDSPVYRAGMINGIACGNLPAVIAGYVRSDCKMAAYSAGGPTLNADRLTGPDASAVSDDSVALRGVLSAGSSSGSRVSMNGTSVSTPQVARWAANQIALSPTTLFTRANVVAKALADDPPSQGKPSAFRIGGGRMNLDTVFGELRWSDQ